MEGKTKSTQLFVDSALLKFWAGFLQVPRLRLSTAVVSAVIKQKETYFLEEISTFRSIYALQ